MEKVRQIFKGVEDPRTSNATLRDLVEMLLISVFSSLCGGRTCVDMVDCAKNNEAFLRQFMRPENGPPSHDAFSRLFRMIEPEPFAKALSRFASDWATALAAEGIRQIVIDGKALRRTFSRAEELSPLHLVNAFAPESGIVLGQVAVDKKSNEIRALPALLEMLDLKGAIVTADAKAWLEDSGNAGKMLSHQEFDRGHGREETRTATVSRDIGPLQDAHRWPGLKAIGKIESVRVSEGRTRTRTRLYIMSRKMFPEEFLKAVRNRWAIENKLHWVLDVRRREDELRNRRNRGPENLAAARRLVLSVVHNMDDKLSIRRRFLKAAQVPEYRLKLIRNAAKMAEQL